MSMQEGVRLSIDFSAGMANLACPVAKPSYRVTLRGIRLVVAATDFVQTVAVGLAVHVAVSGHELGLWKVFALGLLVAGMAVAVRRGVRSTGTPGKGSAFSPSVQAALSTLVSLFAAGAICWLLAPRATTEFIVSWFAAWAAVSSALSAALRVAAASLRKVLVGAVRVVVVGRSAYTTLLAQAETCNPNSRWCVTGHIDVTEPGWLDCLYSTVVEGGVDVVALALADEGEGTRIGSVCSGLADQPVRICLAVDSAAIGRSPSSLERFGSATLIDLVGDPHAGLGGAAKRAMDILLSALALAVLSPVFAVIALFVRRESPGPVLFRQKRFGLGGRAIEVLKFRSMYIQSCDPKGENQTLARDPRVTRMGRVLRRLSLDELPQLLNVLRGDMSLVGPRPHPLHMRVGQEYYFDAVTQYRVRHIVRPGITGWAQVNGSRGEVDTIAKARRRVELDLWYLENWSVGLDLRIILRTICGGFASKGAD